MRHIQNGGAILFHGWNTTEVNNHILIAKHGSTIGNHYFFTTAILHFLHRMLHALRTHKLPFFKIYHFARIRRCHY